MSGSTRLLRDCSQILRFEKKPRLAELKRLPPIGEVVRAAAGGVRRDQYPRCCRRKAPLQRLRLRSLHHDEHEFEHTHDTIG